jgi:ferredoxin-NADP reductase
MKTLPFIYNQPKEFLASLQPKEWADFILGEINPLFSFTATKARVLAIRKESKDSKTLVLQTNRNWKGFQAGQHVPVTLEIAGRRVTRFYSLSSAPSEKYPTITVKKQNGGLVSHFINDRVQVGDILELGTAQGDFVLPKELPSKILMIAGGSGITPIHSILKDLSKRNFTGKVKLLYFSRFKEDIIFYDSFVELEAGNPWLEIKHVLTDVQTEGFDFGFLTKEMLHSFAPDLSDFLVYLCGPAPLQESVKLILGGSKIISELFLLPNQVNAPASSTGPKEVVLLQSHRTILLKGEKSILEELEDNGIYAPSGCKMGICHTCVCKKVSGSVTNLMNHKLSDEGEENIQICVSRVEERLELDL